MCSRVAKALTQCVFCVCLRRFCGSDSAELTPIPTPMMPTKAKASLLPSARPAPPARASHMTASQLSFSHHTHTWAHANTNTNARTRARTRTHARAQEGTRTRMLRTRARALTAQARMHAQHRTSPRTAQHTSVTTPPPVHLTTTSLFALFVAGCGLQMLWRRVATVTEAAA